MVKLIKPRCLRANPEVLFFKPQGVPLSSLEVVVLMPDEFEAIKLHDVDGFGQVEAAKKMGISQPTFARTLDRVYKKVAQAIVMGKAIRIEKKQGREK